MDRKSPPGCATSDGQHGHGRRERGPDHPFHFSWCRCHSSSSSNCCGCLFAPESGYSPSIPSHLGRSGANHPARAAGVRELTTLRDASPILGSGEGPQRIWAGRYTRGKTLFARKWLPAGNTVPATQLYIPERVWYLLEHEAPVATPFRDARGRSAWLRQRSRPWGGGTRVLGAQPSQPPEPRGGSLS